MMINEEVYKGFCKLSKQLERMSGFKLILPSWNDLNQLGVKALASLWLPGKGIQDFEMDKGGLDQCRRAVSLAKLNRPLDVECDSRQSVKVPHVTEIVRVRLEPVRLCGDRQFQETSGTSVDVGGLEEVREPMSKVGSEWVQETSEVSVNNDQQEKAHESTLNVELGQTQEVLPNTEQEEKDQGLNTLDASAMRERMLEGEALFAGWKLPECKVRGADWGRLEALRRGLCFDSNKDKDIPELYFQAIAAYSL